MIKAFTGKTYTADRENLWRDFALRGYNTITGYNDQDKVTSQKTSFLAISDWGEKLLFSILECESAGTGIRSFSGSDPAAASWSIAESDNYYQISGGAKIYGKRNLTTDIPHLKFIAASSRSVSCPHAAISNGTDLTVYFYITPLAVDKEQYIISQEGAFSIYLDATNHIVFTVSDGANTYSMTSTGTLLVNTQYRICCQYTMTPSSSLMIWIDDDSDEKTDNTIVLAHPATNFFIGCKDVGGSKSAYLDACIHTLAIRDGTLIYSQLVLIDNSINPVGMEIIGYVFDGDEGTLTGVPCGLRRITYRFPFYRQITHLEKDTDGNMGATYA